VPDQGVVVGSSNARVGLPLAIEVLRSGGSALDAAVAAVKAVEDDVNDHGVGTGGLPNVLGQVELDASIMDGRDRAAGAVGALKGFRHPIEVARKVMETMPHVLLVGEGAELFARRHGFEEVDLLTAEAERLWRERRFSLDDGSGFGGVGEDRRYLEAVAEWTAALHPSVLGTTNVLVRDGAGNIAGAVSTSGWGFKWPGRLGDSPLIGAGNYADNRFGAAACTGRGELAIRGATAHSVVTHLRHGLALEEAIRLALEDIRSLPDPYAEQPNSMNIVALDREGRVAAASTAADARFVFQRTDMAAPEEALRSHVPLS
jgi:beta-aspartyl-peptidase (threonine type)